jgi:hypothetical protein
MDLVIFQRVFQRLKMTHEVARVSGRAWCLIGDGDPVRALLGALAVSESSRIIPSTSRSIGDWDPGLLLCPKR